MTKLKLFYLRSIFLSLMLAAAAAGATIWWRGRPERYLREAERCLAEGSPNLAVGWLDVPERVAATRDRARTPSCAIALAGGRPKEAVGPLQQVDPSGPWAAEAAFWKGRTLYSVGNTPLAIVWLRTAPVDRPSDPETLRWLAAAAYDLGDQRTVLELLKALTRLEPRDARAWRMLALVTQEEPDSGVPELNAARTAYETTLAIDRDQPRVRWELAGVLVKLGQYDQAEQQLALCRGRVPDADHAELLAECAYARGESDRCRAIVDAGLTKAPNHPGLRVRVRAHRPVPRPAPGGHRGPRPGRGRRPLQLAAVVHAERDSPAGRARDEADRDGARAAELKGAVVTMSNLCAEAARSPLDAGVRIKLGRLCEFLGKRELAASWYRAALACDPRSPEARAALALLSPR